MRKLLQVVLVAGFVFWALPLFAAKTLDIYVLDVQLGNAVLVVSPSGEIMMLDAGPPGAKFVNRIMDALQLAGARQIDYMVISHYHWDHFGTVPELVKRIPIRNFVDHGYNAEVGRSAEWRKHWLRMQALNWEQYANKPDPREIDFKNYLKARETGHHILAVPGEKIPIHGLDAVIVTSAASKISCPMPVAGAGKPNAACAQTEIRVEDETEDAQSVGVVLQYGKFRFADFGDLDWNVSRRLFCPNNLVGPVDAYVISHHGMRLHKDVIGEVDWGRSSVTPAEVYGLHPRVAFLSAGFNYIFNLATPEAFQLVKNSPGMEDIWQTTYQMQGGKEGNSPERFVANLCPECKPESLNTDPNSHTWNNLDPPSDEGHWIKLSAQPDGSFTVTNGRNRYTKNYPAR
jgi:competence protein ComEC